MKNLILVTLAFSLIGCAQQPPRYVGETAQTFNYQGYILNVYSDGSGSFGRQQDMDLIRGNRWSFIAKQDEVTDLVVLNARRRGLSNNPMIVESSLGILVDLSEHNLLPHRLCVSGHDFPGVAAYIRIGDSEAIRTSDSGCINLTEDIDQSLRNAEEVIVRGTKWPYRTQITTTVNLDGYSQLTDYLRSVKRYIKTGTIE